MRAAIAEGDITDDELLRVAPALEERKWHVGLDVQAGDVYSFHSLLWVCVQAHRTQMGWEPGKLPSLWRRVEAIQPEEVRVWALHVDYSAGDVVAYPEESSPEYTCLTGHTSQAGWEPPYVPALWQLHNRG